MRHGHALGCGRGGRWADPASWANPDLLAWALQAMSGRGRGRGARGRLGRGFGPGGGPPFGPPWGGPPFGQRRRMRRGDVRAAVLVLLAEEPRNGYALMQEVEQRSEGAWRPSPGSVYPTLAQLEDEGLVRAEVIDGRKRFALTEEGRAYLEQRREEFGEPWTGLNDDFGEGRARLRNLASGLGGAVMQVAASGDDAQVEQASRVLAEARKALYRILAEEFGDESSQDVADV
jgi:DNA-binding PadR family transcriptional regulator